MKIKTIPHFYTLLFVVLISLQLRAQSSDNLLQVKGETILYTTPEIMGIRIPVEVKEPDYEVCSTRLPEVFEHLKTDLVTAGIAETEIRTEGMSVRENYKWEDRTKLFDGYLGQVGVVIELPYSIEKLNIMLSVLKSDTYRFGYRLYFKLSEEQKQDLRDQGIEKALADARQKAALIAKSMEIELGAIKLIDYGDLRFTHNDLIEENEVFYMTEEKSYDMPPLRDLNPNRMQIKKAVNVVWHIKQD